MTGLNKLRMNLTVMNTIVLLGLSVFIAVVLYATISLNRDSDINNSLEIYCAQLAGNLDYLESEDPESPELEEDRVNFQAFLEGLNKNNVTYMVWNENFEAVSASTHLNIDPQELKNLILRYVAEKQSKYWVANYRTDTQNLKVCTYTIIGKDGGLKTFQVIKDMSSESSVLANAVNIMSIVVIIGAVASGLCGYFLSGRSLVPIKKGMEHQQEFLADASHELRTPIAVIQTNLEVVRGDGEESVNSQMEWLNNAYDETKRMHRIVEDLMFLARADAGEVHIEDSEVDLGFLCCEVAERMLTVAAGKQINLLVDVPDTPLMVFGDESQLTQLLVILIDNAIKYSESGTYITVSAEKAGTMVVMKVVDQGIGIPEADLKKVFQRFYRVDKARSREEGGTGLGLSIAQWIVERHRGVIDASSEEGRGTTMVVKFTAYSSTDKEASCERTEV